MKRYQIKPYNRKSYSAVSVHFLINELETITAQAVKFGIPRHTLLTRAIRLGLPQVLAHLDAKAARLQATKEGE